jgi:SsrA-binding protein
MITDKPQKNIATNRKARHEYFVEERCEAGLVLCGTEVKALRAGSSSLVDSYAEIVAGEAWLCNCHVAPYDHGNRANTPTKRKRKLLLHRKEIKRLGGKISQKGFTLIPLRLYFSGSRVKVELGLCRGKKAHDKRTAIKERDEQRMMDRERRDLSK